MPDNETPKPPEGHHHHPHKVVQRGQVSHMEELPEQPASEPVKEKETLHSTADKSE